jgi:hypothetical protein
MSAGFTRRTSVWGGDEESRRFVCVTQPETLHITRYGVLEDANRLVEIAEWESPEARQTWLDRIVESGDLGPLMEVLGAPFKATNVRKID